MDYATQNRNEKSPPSRKKKDSAKYASPTTKSGIAVSSLNTQNSSNIRPPPNFVLTSVLQSKPAIEEDFDINDFMQKTGASPVRNATLSAFGLKASPVKVNTTTQRVCYLYLTAIKSEVGAYIIFRVHPVDEKYGNMGEKYFYDAVFGKEGTDDS